MMAFAVGVAGGAAQAQGGAKPPAADTVASIAKAVGRAESGHCEEAAPVLRRNLKRITDKELRYHAAFAVARCAMSVNDTATAADALALLRRDFPDDPEVLYAAIKVYSQLADRAAQELVARFPNSPQLGKLNAEALESKKMWTESIDAYRKILAQDPKIPGIHFRIASILLDTSATAESLAEAKKELQAELEIDPDSAAAVFVLGEVARRSGSWDEAIRLFTRASQLDVGFLEAYLALGMSCNAAGKYADAIAPLERYAKSVPNDPAGHYQLAVAYSRTGNKAGADRELQLQREAAAKAGPTAPPDQRVPQ